MTFAADMPLTLSCIAWPKHQIAETKKLSQIWSDIPNLDTCALIQHSFMHRRGNRANLIEHVTADAYGVGVLKYTLKIIVHASTSNISKVSHLIVGYFTLK